MLVLLLAAWALTLAVERGSLPLLALAMALVGLGFNVKMLAALVVLPTFALVYFVGAPLARRRRIIDLAVAAVVLAAVFSSWVLVDSALWRSGALGGRRSGMRLYDLEPAARPR